MLFQPHTIRYLLRPTLCIHPRMTRSHIPHSASIVACIRPAIPVPLLLQRLGLGTSILEPDLDRAHGHVELCTDLLAQRGVGLGHLAERRLEHAELRLGRASTMLDLKRIQRIEARVVCALRCQIRHIARMRPKRGRVGIVRRARRQWQRRTRCTVHQSSRCMLCRQLPW